MINQLLKDGHILKIIIVTKDILEELVQQAGWEYHNLAPEGRRNKNLPGIINSIWVVIKTEFRMLKIIREFKPDLLAGTELTLAHLGRFFSIPSYIFNEDDTKATPENYLFYPFATNIITPECCDRDRWKKNRVEYRGYHELAYLHPKYFTPDKKIMEKINPENQPFFILRLAELTASHDLGKSGLSDEMVEKIIELLKPKGRIFITSERKIREKFEAYRLNINYIDIFHVLYFADLYIGDSQTMAAEAAVMGTPSIRFNDFIGKLGYLNELENKYHLTAGIKTSEVEKLYSTIETLTKTRGVKKEWQLKRDIMIKDMVDVNNRYVDLLTQGAKDQK